MPDFEKKWTDNAAKLLVGKTIKSVTYLGSKEAEELGWYARCICIELNDGTVFYPSKDDEGNGPGALHTTNDSLPIIPVIRIKE